MRSLLLAMAIGCRAAEEPTAEPPSPVVPQCRDDEVPNGAACTRIGVDECASGFTADGAGGCVATLPSCGDGQVALPGDTACHALDECGSGRWGSIPVEADTLYVDAAAADGGDGTASAPYRTLGAAIATLSPARNRMIAVAAGKYAEPGLLIESDARIYGRCASMVELASTETMWGALELHGNVEIRGLSISGGAHGITIGGGSVAKISAVRVHDTGRIGIAIGAPGDSGARATIERVLIERSVEHGVLVYGSELTLGDTVIRDIASRMGKQGSGISIEEDHEKALSSTATIRRVLVERAHDVGVVALGSTASIAGSIIRGTRARPSDLGAGMGVASMRHPKTMKPSSVTISGSFIEDNTHANVYVFGSSVAIDRTVLQKARPRESTKCCGDGIAALEATVDVKRSLVAAHRNTGIVAVASKATLEDTIVRDTIAATDGKSGYGVGAMIGGATGSTVTLLRCRIARNQGAAVAAFGSAVRIEGSALVDTTVKENSTFGDGLFVTAWLDDAGTYPASADVSKTVIAKNARASIFVRGARVSIAESSLTCNGFDIETSNQIGITGSGAPILGDFSIDDRGGVSCGCGSSRRCRAEVSSLEPLGAPVVE
jgi:hypothetical protein